MKYLLLLPAVAALFASSSCRTVTPLDPMTMKQSCKCLPENFRADGSCHASVSGSK
jgi:hypothetical protein